MNILLNDPLRIHRCEPTWSWSVAQHTDHDLWCVLAGRGEICVDKIRYPIHPGCCWLIEPGQSSSAQHDPDNRLRVFAVHFDPITAEGQRRGLRPDERPKAAVSVQDLALLETLARRSILAQRSENDASHPIATHIVRLIHMLLLDASSEASPLPLDTRVSRVHDAILEDPSRDWSVPGMARDAGLSVSQFTRLFRQRTGRSPARCVLEARIDRAGVLLRESDATVGDVADALGYRDIFYFSRQFKALTGLTPSAWRAGSR